MILFDVFVPITQALSCCSMKLLVRARATLLCMYMFVILFEKKNVCHRQPRMISQMSVPLVNN